jgi:hypothetical protein
MTIIGSGTIGTVIGDGMVVMAMASTIGTETIGVGMAVLDGTIGTENWGWNNWGWNGGFGWNNWYGNNGDKIIIQQNLCL